MPQHHQKTSHDHLTFHPLAIADMSIHWTILSRGQLERTKRLTMLDVSYAVNLGALSQSR